MRPPVLNPLFAALTSLSGVGPKLATLYPRLLDHEAPRVIDLLFHLPSGTIDRRARPKLADVVAGQVVTVAVTVDRASPGAAPSLTRALSSRDQRRHRHADADLFQRAQGLPGKALARRRSALRLRHRRILRRHAADGASRPGGGRARLRQSAAGRAGLPAHRGPGARQCAARDGQRLGARCPHCRNGRTPPGLRASAFPPSPTRYAICIGRPSRMTSRPRAWPGRGSPMTNCSPASSRSPCCAPTCAGRLVAAQPAKAACVRAFSRRCLMR